MDTTQSTIRLPLPDEWAFEESITIVAPDGRANVIASSEPAPSGVDTVEYERMQGELLARDLPGYRELSTETLTLYSGAPARLRKITWQRDDGPPLTQLQLYYVEDGRAYTLTATATADDFESHELLFAEVLSGLSVVSPHVV